MAKIYEKFNSAEKLLIGLIMLLLICLGLTQVLCRFVFKIALAWTEELMTFCLVWVTYLGADAAANEKKHIIVNFLVNLFPPKTARILTLISQAIWIVLAGVMVYLGYVVTSKYISRGAATLGGHYPFWIASIVIPVSMAFMIVRVVLLMIDTVKGKSDERSIEEIIEEETAE